MVGPLGKVLPGALVVARVVPVQLSVKVGAVQLTTALQDASAFTVMFAGHPMITGGVISFTVTMNEQVAVLPAASVAVQVTMVGPLGKVLPGALVVARVVPVQLSVKVG